MIEDHTLPESLVVPNMTNSHRNLCLIANKKSKCSKSDWYPPTRISLHDFLWKWGQLQLLKIIRLVLTFSNSGRLTQNVNQGKILGKIISQSIPVLEVCGSFFLSMWCSFWNLYATFQTWCVKANKLGFSFQRRASKQVWSWVCHCSEPVLHQLY